MRLTDAAIKRLPNTETGQKRYRDDLLPGFGLTVGKKAKTFFVMFGEDRRVKTLGRYPDKSLKEARGEAKRVLALASPRKCLKSIADARTAFYDDCLARGLRQTTVDRYKYSLDTVKDARLDRVDTDVTDPNLLKALKAFYNWCIDHQLIDHNPFIRRKVIFGVRERLLTDEEIAKIWHYEYPPYSDIVKLLILTGQRRNQIWKFQPEWCQDDLVTFPTSVMKTKRPLTLPITGYGWFLQSFTFNSWSKNKKRMDTATGVTDFVLHDFRRYFSSTCARLQIPLHITELILDHRTSLSGIAAVYNKYQYLNEMREALLTYEQHVRKITTS